MADPSMLDLTAEELTEVMRHAWKAEQETAANRRERFNEGIQAFAAGFASALNVLADDKEPPAEDYRATLRAADEEIRAKRLSRTPVLLGMDLAGEPYRCPTLGRSLSGGAGR